MFEHSLTVLLVEADDATRMFRADNLTADGLSVLTARGLRARLLPGAATVPTWACSATSTRVPATLSLLGEIRAGQGQSRCGVDRRSSSRRSIVGGSVPSRINVDLETGLLTCG